MENFEEQPITKECNSLENSNIVVDTNSNGSSLGKFKYADELLKAYQMLEKECTKKCQKIKELEASKDNEKISPVKTDNETNSPEDATNCISNDVLHKISIKDMGLKTEKKTVGDAVSQTLQSLNNNTIAHENSVQEIVNTNSNSEGLLLNEEFKQLIYSNTEIRNKVIENYLNEIQSQKQAPLMVNTKASNFCVMPKSKPQSLSDAGEIAKEMLNN